MHKGKLTVVGIGPGDPSLYSHSVLQVLEDCDVIAGYKGYISLLPGEFRSKATISTGMRGEVERMRLAIEAAESGRSVVLVCSGDAGVYGLAGLAYELLEEMKLPDLPVDILPGITAATAAASILGAPLIHDFVLISLSDLLTPWALIRKRLHAAGNGDFVTVIYNPKSRSRQSQFPEAVEILLQYRKPSTPSGIVRQAYRSGEESCITSLEDLKDQQVDMFSTVIVGNSSTKIINGKMVTPRGYRISG